MKFMGFASLYYRFRVMQPPHKFSVISGAGWFCSLEIGFLLTSTTSTTAPNYRSCPITQGRISEYRWIRL